MKLCISSTPSVVLIPVLFVLTSVPVMSSDAAGEDRPNSGASATAAVGDETPWTQVFLPNGEPAGRRAPLPADVEVRRLTVDGSGVTAGSRVTTLVYSNTGAIGPDGTILGEVFARGANLRVADDMTTIAVQPCPLNEVIVWVHGGNFDPEAPAGSFDVTFGVWTSCPSQGGQLLPGTSLLSVEALEDNVLWELSIPLPTHPMQPTPTIWVSGRFSTGTAGFIVGFPPEIGTSEDGYDDPVFGCSDRFGEGWPTFSYASWAAKVYAEGVCETHFVAYAAINDNAKPFDRGRDVRVADDLILTVDVCELSTYEIAVLGTSSNYTVSTDLRTGDTNSGPLEVIPGTEAAFQGTPGSVRHFRQAFPPGIALRKDDGVWMTWSADRSDTGLLRSGDTQVGDSTDFYAWEDPVLGWRVEFFPGAAAGVFYVSVNCRGETPLGACCEMFGDPPTGVCVDQVSAPGCQLGRWVPNVSSTELTECYDEGTATPDPFDPPCGTAACCFESRFGDSECENLTKAECNARNDCTGFGCLGLPGIWQPGAFCGEEGQECFQFACYFPEDTCGIINEDPGETSDRPGENYGRVWSGLSNEYGPCGDLECCDRVCDYDSFCCDPQNGWDAICAERALNLCAFEPRNDECFEPTSGQEALNIPLILSNGTWTGIAEVRNMALASRNFVNDPPFCCNNVAVNEPGHGTLWYYFNAGNNTSARITTCNTPSGPGQDSFIQVFRENPLQPGSWSTLEAACDNLGYAVACNDDAGCGPSGRNSDLRVAGLRPNETVMIMVASPTQAGTFGDYKLTVEAPCPSGSMEPTYSACRQAFGPILGSASGIEDEVRFDCSGDPGTVCLENASMQCPGEPALPAMKNDIWIGYDPGCTGTLRVSTCEDVPPSPDTTLAIYGRNPAGGGTCPADDGLLFGANDDCPTTPVEAVFNDQICTVGTESCSSSGDCAIPGSTCIGNQCVLSCTSSADCMVNAVSIGECVDQVCVRSCETDADCPLKTCTIAGNLCTLDSDCITGITSWTHDPCETDDPTTFPLVCRNRPDIVCTINGGQCDQVPNAGSCITQTCKRIETCEPEVCQSSCWPGSSITAPVNRFETYIVRIGGEFGSEPVGSLHMVCTEQDCDVDGVPDVCGVSCAAMDGVCGHFELCGTAADVNGNGTPDECDPHVISFESVATHGAYGPIGLPIPDDGSFTEPRSTGVRELLVTYDGAVSVTEATAVTVQSCNIKGMPADLSATMIEVTQGAADEVVITFTPALPGSGLTPGTHDPVRYLVELTGVGGAVADTSREFTVVLGDAFGLPIGTGDGRVNAQDNGFVRAWASGNVIPINPDPETFARVDVFTNGVINAQDAGLVRSLAAEGLNGQGIPLACP